MTTLPKPKIKQSIEIDYKKHPAQTFRVCLLHAEWYKVIYVCRQLWKPLQKHTPEIRESKTLDSIDTFNSYYQCKSSPKAMDVTPVSPDSQPDYQKQRQNKLRKIMDDGWPNGLPSELKINLFVVCIQHYTAKNT